ncbi:hypothetical protein FEM48_Zijuj07G0033800 [Ziziphus jujuba var. spinosa]|uniref:NADP-dependent oxidoreductase domain-containing protein n=1 Tax=Ziziphus jujuba var. spinosa TaxID=714518 RepID=A0A978V261_ZIZJJ|nr:hypothetical protein FEM48_Zijuj07G0033800 [Ziziphus jujuba var. spinosa]
MAQVRRIKLGSQGLEVSAQGLGCMGMSAFYGPPKPDSDMISLIHHAINSGVTLLDTSDYYGPYTNEILLGKVIFFFFFPSASKQTPFQYRFSSYHPLESYFKLRLRSAPEENYVGELKKLVEEGKIKYIGLSEASAATIRRAHAVHPITAVQLEWSLWSRDVEEDIIPTCRELGIGIVAYSPLGRGFLSSGPKLLDELTKEDFRKNQPRFQPENLEHNKTIFERVNEMAERKGCTPSQLALAWVHHQGNDVCPIPGTTKIENFNQNIGALSVKLTPEEKAKLESFASKDVVKGERYATGIPTYKQSDTPPLSSWKAT